MRETLRTFFTSGPTIAFVGLLLWLPGTSFLFEESFGSFAPVPLLLIAVAGVIASYFEIKRGRWVEAILAFLPLFMFSLSWRFAHPSNL